MMLNARYMELAGGSVGSGAWTTDSAAEVGYRNLAIWGVDAMKQAVFWCESERCAFVRRRRVERRTGRETFVAYGVGCVSRMMRRCDGGSST